MTANSEQLANPSHDPNAEEGEDLKLTIFEHLEELRSRLVVSVLGLAVGTIISFIFAERLLKFLTAPAPNVQYIFIRPTEMFITWFKVAFLGGMVIAMPVLLYEFVMFILPGLLPQEKKYLWIMVPGGTLSFFAGLAFGRFLMLPFALTYLASFGSGVAEAQWTIGEYVGFVVTLLLWIGLAFETPLIIFILTKVGLVKPEKLASFRKYAFLGAFVIAAVITPTPDPFNQALVGIPIYLLFEIGLLLSRVAK